MINFDFNQNCYGCRNCENICPNKAIEIIENVEGFLVPKINKEKCVDCGLCERKCPYLSINNEIVLDKSIWYSCYLKDVNERKKSTSGAIFPALAKYFLDNDGLVCGCIWNNEMKPIHVLTDDHEIIEKMRGSKYVQSDLKNIAEEIKKSINYKKVLFTGTPCQVAAIKLYVGENPNLYTCALICEGVPPYKVWNKYVKKLEKKYKSKMINACFRNKELDWNTPVAKYEFANGKTRRTLSFTYDKYVIGFLQGLYYRNSCNTCQYKGNGHNSDILIGDLWGANKKLLEETEYQGISAVLLNSDKGIKMFDKVKNNYIFEVIEREKVVEHNLLLINSMDKHRKRDTFFYNLDKVDIEKNIDNNTNQNKVINYIKEMLYKIKIFKFLKRLKGE